MDLEFDNPTKVDMSLKTKKSNQQSSTIIVDRGASGGVMVSKLY